MMRISMSQVAALTGGRLQGADAAVQGVSTDSRSVTAEQLFVALKGPRFDAHDFICPQFPAAGLLLSRDPGPNQDRPWVLVDDTRRALADLAAGWRRHCPARIVALTGSNGKTTVKEMLAAILGHCGETWATRGNLNNDIGVPLTLLSLSGKHRFGVIEMGANHAGEIALLTRIARPDVALITNAGPAHLEGFGSIEGVAHAKGEIFQGLEDEGVAVINADDPYADLWLSMNPGRQVILFGLSARARVRGEMDGEDLLIHLPDDRIRVSLALAGRHNRLNALAAAAAAHALGADAAAIGRGLALMQPVPGRLVSRPGAAGSRLIDDSYNANPASTRAAIQVLSEQPGHRILVLGDMGELGEDAAGMHREMGALARAMGVERLLAVGPLSRHAVHAFGNGAEHFEDQARLSAVLTGCLGPDVVVLIKGSRGQRMERVVSALMPEQGQRQEQSGDNGHAAHSV
ncbi:UDP-N-acetylmuramoyl-tripeptide--D-alanyl-D-alanine ligase [Ectothiorhodospira lacustris]|uniref:UDP-N-acetylmuramoyl-tripeptide--D-alanyl-D- alanine ligase n=1 Tax=Ectothiorhodospira lacustris TaxID=2899127 RepID=UPI001EE97B6C|nr:UDP-N-acetylmuramoyl-tripeptide--D-alanyl-D-alanine ligase [Ectothiorhodospira lacustris]MCG5501416.1 UDP-N-acetylmuramoyl-tripeptide--D-alanyl-D-alanine ligase [Ectothiorhodospira lacustris]MCG5510534.1 UDP-N-acetylmuramoyl-tripeptide--D-alanyl-D-alanine ligase [Ectothiorhodospira lacustris]MCG5521226.1 UDP-N-acetylmuramoyl-tripeptide--D-alanyl-D-alanine ligase [Ectothiorhodospira lacustris]